MNKIHENVITLVANGVFGHVYIAHIRCFRDVKKLGDKLVVILNGDEFLKYD